MQDPLAYVGDTYLKLICLVECDQRILEPGLFDRVEKVMTTYYGIKKELKAIFSDQLAVLCKLHLKMLYDKEIFSQYLTKDETLVDNTFVNEV